MDITEPSCCGCTALLTGSRSNLRAFSEAGADVNVPNINNYTALCAVLVGAILSALHTLHFYKHKADPDIYGDSSVWTAGSVAIKSDSISSLCLNGTSFTQAWNKGSST